MRQLRESFRWFYGGNSQQRAVCGVASENISREIMLQVISLIAIGALLVFGAVVYLSGQHLYVCVFDLAWAAVFFLNLCYFRYSGNQSAASLFAVAFSGSLLFFCLISGGTEGTGYLWGYAFPLLAFSLMGVRQGLGAVGFYCAASIVFFLVGSFFENLATYTTTFEFRFVASFVVVSAYAGLTEALRSQAQLRLVESNQDLQQAVGELRGTEEALRRAGEELEERVQTRTAELHQANERLVAEIEERLRAEEEQSRLRGQLAQAQKMEAIGLLAGGVAHDLNNILAGIIGYPELLLMDLPEHSPLRPRIEAVQKSGQKAAAVVQDLLTLARRGGATKEGVEINRIVQEYLESLEFQALMRHHPAVRLMEQLEEGLPAIRGSGVQLMQMLMNLIINAAEAMPDGGTICVSTAVCRNGAEGGKVPPGRYVILMVSDTGVGIASQDLERIFEPFFTRKVMGRSGSGLGMAVVWNTVRDHGGFIECDSARGQGTTFTLYFPVTQMSTVQVDLCQGRQGCRGDGERILIVDDVALQREIGSDMLRRLAYNVDCVSSGEEALEYLHKRPVDLLVLDMVMDPGMDGLETFRQARRLDPCQKALLVSGYSESIHIQEALDLGVGAFLKKPYLFEELGQAVRAVLQTEAPGGVALPQETIDRPPSPGQES